MLIILNKGGSHIFSGIKHVLLFSLRLIQCYFNVLINIFQKKKWIDIEFWS